MSGRGGTVILAVACIIFSGLIFFMAGEKDNAAPEITYEKKSIYYDGEDESTLLEGVRAVDRQDGDVSDSLMIVAVYRTSEQTGVVIYAAKDASNNVTTRGRGFFYEGYDAAQLIGISNNDETGTEADMTDEETEDSGDEQEIQGTVVTIDEEYEALKEENLAQGIPFVKLLQHEVTLARGSTFNIYRYIEEAVDDVDTIKTMLRVRGNVDTAVPGDYEVTVFAKDSAGNESNREVLTVTVE